MFSPLDKFFPFSNQAQFTVFPCKISQAGLQCRHKLGAVLIQAEMAPPEEGLQLQER